LERRFEEFRYVVKAKFAENKSSVEFSVHPDNVHQEARFVGYIKGDGCSNWHLHGRNCQLHFCNQKEANQFGQLLSKLYDWASELMPQHKEKLGSKND
jgi:hypothetical protein